MTARSDGLFLLKKIDDFLECNKLIALCRRCRFFCRFFLFSSFLGLVDRLDHSEEYECKDDEVEDCRDECTDTDEHFTNVDADGTEVCLKEQADNRVDDVFNQRVDDGLECTADDNADSHVHDIASQCECLEFFHKFLHKLLFLSPYQFQAFPPL